LPPDAYKTRGAVRLNPTPTVPGLMISNEIEQPPQIFFTPPEPVAETNNPDLIFLKANYVPKLLGDFIDFVDDHPILKFNETDVDVVIEYSGLKTDKEGVPMFPEDAAEACMFFCLFTYYQSAYLAQKIPRALMMDAERWKDDGIKRGKAKMTMSGLTSNETDRLMNIMVTMDRKAFNLPS
jgi:hypothetical protein